VGGSSQGGGGVWVGGRGYECQGMMLWSWASRCRLVLVLVVYDVACWPQQGLVESSHAYYAAQ
jgi:hypothetical protein